MAICQLTPNRLRCDFLPGREFCKRFYLVMHKCGIEARLRIATTTT